jgi:hypothetical protein
MKDNKQTNKDKKIDAEMKDSNKTIISVRVIHRVINFRF